MYNNHLKFLNRKAKWLQSVLTPTCQDNIKSNLQLIGERGGGKSTLAFYFDKDHPKEPSVLVPAGSSSFWQRFDLSTVYETIPDNLIAKNNVYFAQILRRPGCFQKLLFLKP